jgi:hypothetical protein
MSGIQFNVTVDGLDGIDLTTVIGERSRYDHDIEETVRQDVTLGDEVAKRVTAKLTKDDQWDGIRKRFLAIRDEEIREAVKPLVAEAITAAIEQTNGYGERTGQSTTMRELVMAEAKKLFTDRADYGRGSTLAQRIVAEAVGSAFTRELAAAIADEKAKVIAAVRGKAAELLAEAVKQGLGR